MTERGRARDPLARFGRFVGMRGDPDGLDEVLRRYGVRPGSAPEPPDVPDPGRGLPRLVGRQNDPTWVFFLRTAWRDLARQRTARRAARRQR